MSLPKFFMAGADPEAPVLTLDAKESHHAARVLRLREGDEAIVLDGAGGRFQGTVQLADRRSVRIAVRTRRRDPAPAVPLVLAVSVLKQKAMEWLVEKASELGASRVAPLLTERTVAAPGKSDYSAKRDKWRTTAVESIKQCGAGFLPRIDLPRSFDQAVRDLSEGDPVSLFGSLDPKAAPIDQALRAAEKQDAPPRAVIIWIGPEGDFTPMEIDRLRTAGALGVTLGPRVLRAETAALCSLSIVEHEMRKKFQP